MSGCNCRCERVVMLRREANTICRTQCSVRSLGLTATTGSARSDTSSFQSGYGKESSEESKSDGISAEIAWDQDAHVAVTEAHGTFLEKGTLCSRQEFCVLPISACKAQ